jgi:hypothetical protein
MIYKTLTLITSNINLTNINTNIFKITLTHKLGIKVTYLKIYPNNIWCFENLYKLQITQSLKKHYIKLIFC